MKAEDWKVFKRDFRRKRFGKKRGFLKDQGSESKQRTQKQVGIGITEQRNIL